MESAWKPSNEDRFDEAPREIQEIREKACHAAREGRAADLAKCFETGHLLYTPRNQGLLYSAFVSQSIQIFEVLLKYGWDINAPESWDYPPYLGKIIRDGYYSGSVNMELLQWFLDHGANPNAYARVYATTPLSDAVCYGSLNLVKLLFNHGGSALEGDLIYYALKSNSINNGSELLLKVRFLIDKGAPVNDSLFERFPHLLDVTMFTYTPLINACVSGHVELVTLLLAAGADPRKAAWCQLTPLQAAEKNGGHEEIKRILSDALALLPRL